MCTASAWRRRRASSGGATSISSIRAFDLTTQRSGERVPTVTILPIRVDEGRSASQRRTLFDRARPSRHVARPCSTCCPPTRSSSRRSPTPMPEEVDRAPGARRSTTSRSPGAWARTPRPAKISSSTRMSGVGATGELPAPAAARRAGRSPGRLPAAGAGRSRPQPAARACWRRYADADPLRQRRPAASGSTSCCDDTTAVRRSVGPLCRRRARRRLRDADAPGPHRSRDLPPRPPAPAGPPLPPGRADRRSPATLSPGDYVVHLDHGIGIYRGIATITVEGGVIEVRGGRVRGRRPAQRAALPARPAGALSRRRGDGDEPPPKLHRLGGTHWKKVREKTREAIQAMAAELLDLYARRQSVAGFAFPPDTRWQRELESCFLYEDTPDQRKRHRGQSSATWSGRCRWTGCWWATSATARPRSRCAPRSRRCRAASRSRCWCRPRFSPSSTGRTFTERLADYPVKVEVLSRFRTAQGAEGGARAPGAGEIDIVIGTHRLLSKRRALQGSRPADRRRGASLRRQAQGAAQDAAPRRSTCSRSRRRRFRARCTCRSPACAT